VLIWTVESNQPTPVPASRRHRRRRERRQLRPTPSLHRERGGESAYGCPLRALGGSV